MTRDVDATELKHAAAVLEAARPIIDHAGAETVDAIGDLALINVRRRRARHHVTGRGERFITLRTEGSDANHRATVHAAGRIAPLIAGGTRRHVIRPHGAHALRMASGPRPFAANVRHPGTRADPFVHEGITDTRQQVARITDQTGAELVADLARAVEG